MAELPLQLYIQAFPYYGKVSVELYAKRELGLHLNTEGTNRLTPFFLRVISTLKKTNML